MPEQHVYDKDTVARRLDDCLGKTFGEIDTAGIFDAVMEQRLQKGVAGKVMEQCVFGYAEDTRQEADLIITEGEESIRTELKTTGMVLKDKPKRHYEAKEPMSITAVGIYDIDEQDFYTSHFWDKLEHMLIIYYLYDSKTRVNAYGYRLFSVKGYEFHEFSQDDTQTLKEDWEHVRSLCAMIVSHHPGEHDQSWRMAVRREYIDTHGQLRRQLSYIDLAPEYPPRFRLKKPTVSAMIAEHFGYELEQLPRRYSTVTDIDSECRELTKRYAGMTIKQIASELGVSYDSKRVDKGIMEQVTVAMFGGTAKKLNKVDVFNRFGLVAKSITMTASGCRTEDMKLFHVDFDEMMQEYIEDEDGSLRLYQFEDSELYTYFADNELLCIIFQEPERSKKRPEKDQANRLDDNIFCGFKRIVFDDTFICTVVKPVWEDTRRKISNHELKDVPELDKDGRHRLNKNGEPKSAPNFMKSRDNPVFFRGSGTDSSLKHKTECVNGIKMLPQYIWIKGTEIVKELEDTPML